MTRAATQLLGSQGGVRPDLEIAPRVIAPVAEPPRDPRLGTVIADRYRIDRVLGQGGVGVVFEGEHLLLKRRVAIKCLHPQYARDPATIGRFHQEARTVTAIGHPNIIEALDMGTMADGSAFVVFEYLEGRDLAAEIEARGPLPVAEVIEIAKAICDAFEATHRRGIVHRDIKPENIFLAEREGKRVVKLLDFGISKVQQAGVGFTSADTVIGTPHYLSPEQASGRDVDHRTDLHALGAVLYVALSGDLPFDADSIPALMLKVCTETPPPLRRARPDAPLALEMIVTRLMAKQRDARFESARELRAALERVITTCDAARPSFETAESNVVVLPEEEERPPKKRALLVALGCVLVGFAAVAIFFVAKQPDPATVPPIVAAPHADVPVAAPPAPIVVEEVPEAVVMPEPVHRARRRVRPAAPQIAAPVDASPPAPVIAPPPPVMEEPIPPQGLRHVEL